MTRAKGNGPGVQAIDSNAMRLAEFLGPDTNQGLVGRLRGRIYGLTCHA